MVGKQEDTATNPTKPWTLSSTTRFHPKSTILGSPTVLHPIIASDFPSPLSPELEVPDKEPST